MRAIRTRTMAMAVRIITDRRRIVALKGGEEDENDNKGKGKR